MCIANDPPLCFRVWFCARCGLVGAFFQFVGMFLVKGNGNKLARLPSTNQIVASTMPFTNISTTSLKVPRLEVASDGYLVVPLSYYEGQEGKWSLTIVADTDFQCTLVQ